MEVLPQIVTSFGSFPLAAQFSSGEPTFLARIPLAGLPKNAADFLKNILEGTRAQIHLEDFTLRIGGTSIPLPQNVSLPMKGSSPLPVLATIQENFLTLIQDERPVQPVRPFHMVPLGLQSSITHLQEIVKDIFPAVLRQQAREALLPPLHHDLGVMSEKTKPANFPSVANGQSEERVLTPTHLEKSSILKNLLLQVLHQKPNSERPLHSTSNTELSPNVPRDILSGVPPRTAEEKKPELSSARNEQVTQRDGTPKTRALAPQQLLSEAGLKALIQRLDALLLQPKLPSQEVKQLLQTTLQLLMKNPELLENAADTIPTLTALANQSRPERQEHLLKVIRELLKTLDDPNPPALTPSEKSAVTSILRGMRGALSRETSSTELAEPELLRGEQTPTQKGELLGALKMKPETRTPLQNVVEQFAQGQELLGRLNPLMQQLGEPIFLLVPGFLQGFLQRLEVTIHPAHDQQNGNKRRQNSQYCQCSVQCEFPSLGQIRLDIAYSKKQVLMRFIAESSSTATLIQENLPKLAEILDAAGFPRTDLCCQQKDKIDSVRPGWVGDITGLRMLV